MVPSIGSSIKLPSPELRISLGPNGLAIHECISLTSKSDDRQEFDSAMAWSQGAKRAICILFCALWKVIIE